MALTNALMKVGGELAEAGAKNAGSALARLVGNEAVKVAPKVATTALTPKLVNSSLSTILKPEADDTVKLFRGQKLGNDNLYYNKGVGASSTMGNGYYMTPNAEKAGNWAENGLAPVEVTANKADVLTTPELVEKANWANDLVNDNKAMMKLYETDPAKAELVEALSMGRLPEVSKYLDKPFIIPDSGQGAELSETVFFPDTRPELTKNIRSDLKARANSRLADESGKPMTLYHSTPNEFDKFDDAMLGKNTFYENTSVGHFATPDKDFSKRFIDIDNTGKTGRTMELQARVNKPITHPYQAGAKYEGDELDNVIRNYFTETDNLEGLNYLTEMADEEGISLYDAYMDLASTGEESPWATITGDRETLMNKGYDAMEIVEGLKRDLVDGSKEKGAISSYAVFNGDNLRPVKHIPIDKKGRGASVNVNRVDMSSLDNELFKATGSDYDISLFAKAKNGKVLTPEEISKSPFAKALEARAEEARAKYGKELISKAMGNGEVEIPADTLARISNIADEVVAKAKSNPNIAYDRKAVIFMGGPSSGKSSAGMKLYDADKGGNYFVLDSDDIKPMFEEFGAGEGAGIVHEASAYASNNLVKPAMMADGANLAIPVVGKTTKSLYKNIAELANAGYDVSVVLTELPVEKAASRNFTRMLETGRNVADAYVRDVVGDKPAKVFKKMVEDIKSGVLAGVNGFARVNNDVELGSLPILKEFAGGSDNLTPLLNKLKGGK